jgi:hypothetical protein
LGGRTRHVGIRLNFLRELKEKGFMEVDWINLENNVADIFTKNLPIVLYDKHVKTLGVGNWTLKDRIAPGEGVKDTG